MRLIDTKETIEADEEESIPVKWITKWGRHAKGRLKFGDGKQSAPFPSMLVIYKSVD